ncbi:hypothetical protein DTO013E5_2650 [Penicillium roqueforti]|uniref:Genomic scaffold, ProqFM164S02 n=1 Tax=Penicillium roqueforti (strain FM164) TaxID=1365484 RepID=W6Q1G5_PENRF|nr:uncharacterized protein LCP9604111_8618 [Penicillium roqueforti]CDM30383.1 unnamed protein product [Penicillium roqueforti FM164]KAF9240764.1 hypothetical protein LCP9604111_8618 [Penicillium roqueforti]KAI1838387.1 hypothetical protein CBS147337_112 [Penicillium roqueforti]KAI2680882.1 hypothetical protein CBS147355_3862 [Penicillium roqueforti]KAI2691645.1 hypothetical protein LCP963914a_1846 [Penicillium roqueforti]
MPSLTLTDPDMILPYEVERESQTPSPPQIAYFNSRNQSDPNASMSASSRQKKNFSRHAWTHEDVNVSRRLSDIGEELSPARLEGFGDSDEQELASSPLLRGQDDPNREWSSSNSTISAGSRRASASRDVSEAQNGRDESPVHPEVARAQATAVIGTAGGSSVPASSAVASAAAEGKGPGEEFSSAILSSEAERILENAKKRLNLMENNLTRARSTTPRTTSSPSSPSPSNSGYIQPMGLHQPVGVLYRSISRTDPKSFSLRRQSFITSQDTTNNRHSRGQSETIVPSDSSFSNDDKQVSRSVSAMGASTSSSLHTDDRSFHYAPTRAYLTHRSSISSTQPPIHVQEEKEGQGAQSPAFTEDSSSGSPHGLGISSEEESKSSPDGFSPVYSSFGPPSRAQSQLQVRDLQYQMKGLHIKISSLKVKNQEDNLRRRSLQSLRTPSPLTAADHWYANALELRDGQSSRGSNPRREASSENTRDVSNEIAAEDRRRSAEHAAGNASKHAENWQGNEPDYGDDQSIAETMYEDAEEGDFNEEIDREALDEILREPLDDDLESDMEVFPNVPSHTDATPHELREDAFDYEHFILHSALGNYTQQLRRVSNSSNGSVETTRPAYTKRHSRNNSNMSVSTVATFATANEGERPDDEDDVDSVMYWDRRFNHELRHGHSHSHSQSHTHHSYQPSPIQEIEAENDRSETPRGPRHHTNSLDPNNLSPQKHTGRSSSATAGSATPTSLVSSLVSTVRAASSTPSVGGINDDDTQMLEALFASLGKVCMDLQAITSSADPDEKAARVLRRRLDAARRVLEGELDA